MTKNDYIMRLKQISDHFDEMEEQSRFYWQMCQDLILSLEEEPDGE